MSPGDYDEDGYPVQTANLHGNSGSAHAISDQRKGDDAVTRLREVVAEVTRGRIPVPVRRGAGFL